MDCVALQQSISSALIAAAEHIFQLLPLFITLLDAAAGEIFASLASAAVTDAYFKEIRRKACCITVTIRQYVFGMGREGE